MMLQDSSTSLTVRHRFSASSSASFLTQLGMIASGGGGIGEQEMDVIMLDHCYAKPWSAHPDASSARPVRMLFMPKQTRPSPLELLNRNFEPVIDVVDAAPTPSMPFDVSKARSLMTECERHASYARTDQQEDWEDKICKSGWTVQQTRLFNKVMKALQTDRLARLAMESIGNEPIARRQVVDKTAKRMRQALASVGWDTEVVQWLHQLIVDNLSVHLLACYLDALQTLKAKVPSLVEKMVSGVPPKHPSLSHESLGLLLKRPWDPVGTALSQQKLKKLPGTPLLLLAPSGPSQSGSTHRGHAKRLKFWQTHLNSLGKTIPTSIGGGTGVSVVLCLEQMIGALRTKVVEQKSHYPGVPIILVGWNIGALVACHVSLVESVNAVVCLGFPFTGIHGPRGDCEDPLLGSQTPTFFVVGQNACDCSLDQLQDLREHMRAETGMLVVGGADEQLRLSHRQQREEGLTQAMADRCIIDEIYQFLGSILSMNSGLPDLPTEVAPVDLRRKRKRKAAQDLMGGSSPAESTTPATSAQRAAVSTAPVMVGGTSRVSKRGGKAARLAATLGGSTVTAEGSRPAPRKRQGRGGGVSGGGPSPRKRLALGLGPGGMPGGPRASTGSLEATSKATLSAISTAPELSGLLQGIRVGRSTEGDSSSTGVGPGRSLMATSFPLTKVLTFNKLMEAGGDAGSVGSVSAGSATLLASAIRSGSLSDKDKQQQFLVKAGGSSISPLAIPISVAQRLMAAGGSSPLVHITGAGSSGSSSSQIHQLLTSIAGSYVGGSSGAPTSQPPAAPVTSAVPSPLPAAPRSARPARTDRAGPQQVDAGHVPGEKGDGGAKHKQPGPHTPCSSQRGDVPVTTTSATNFSAVTVPALQKTQPAMSVSSQPVTSATQSIPASGSLTSSAPLPSTLTSQVAVTRETPLKAPPPAQIQQSGMSRAVLAKTLASLTTHLASPVTSLSTLKTVASSEAARSKSESMGSVSVQSSHLVKSGFVQLAVTKSLINTMAGASHSILRVAGSASAHPGQAGSPTATTSILGGRSTVLISPTMAKSLSASPGTAFLLSKGGLSAPGAVGAFRPSPAEVLGKVTSVLEAGAKGAQQAQSSAPSSPMVTLPLAISKAGILSKAAVLTNRSDVVGALKASKPGAGGASGGASPSPVSTSGSSLAVASPPPPPPPLTATSTPATPPPSSVAGSAGRAGHSKSVSAVSYAANSKPVLPGTPTSTRTRRIKTPKQYDL